MIKAFIFSGTVCLIAQIIKDNTKLSNGHITSLFVIIGAFLGFLNIYQKITDYFGKSILIVSFGNTLYESALKNGIFNMLGSVSLGIVASILFAFIVTLIFKVKD